MKQNKKSCDFKTCFLCRECMSEWIPAIEACKKNYHFKKGELIFKEGTGLKGMYFVNNGLVKVHKKWVGDKELIVRFAHDGDILGHRGLGIDMIYSISATALSPTDLCFIDLDFFQKTLKVNQGFLYRLMLFFAEELKISEKKMQNLAHMPVKGRLAQALLSLREKFGVSESGAIKISLSKQDLSSFVGASYETVFRCLNELVEAHIIELSGKNIHVRNEKELKEITEINTPQMVI